MREVLARLWDWIRRDRLDAEVAEELRFHRAQLEQEAVDSGDPDPVAASHRRLGNALRIREHVRDRWSWPWLDHVLQDLRYAVRGLRNAPGFTAAVVVTLGLGIGANAVMFGVVDRLMFRPLPYLRNPSRVDRIYLQRRDRDEDRTSAGMQYTRYLDLQERARTIDRFAAFFHPTMAVGRGAQARERRVAAVSGTLFDFFDLTPALGRFFRPGEDRTPRGADVVVLGYGFWMAEYGGRDVLGEPLMIGSEEYVIIGVAPAGFVGLSETGAPAAFIPITAFAANSRNQDDAAAYYTNYDWSWTQVIVRRREGVDRATASADLTRAFRWSWNKEVSLDPALPSADIANPRAIAGSARVAAGPGPGLEARTLLWVSGVAVIVLVIACANVANLYLARALRRRREVALRHAMGVSRSRLLSLALMESLVLAGLGCLVGIGVAQWGGLALRGFFTAQIPDWQVATDGRTVLIAVGAALLAGLATGLVPLLFTGRGDLTRALRAGAREGTYQRSRARTALLVVQGALSVLLLVGAGLFVRSLGHVRAMRMGYDAAPLVVAERNLRGASLDDSATVQLNRSLLEVAAAEPGVERAALASSVPFWSTSSTDLFVSGIDSVRRLGRFTYQIGSTDYFATMGTRILRGRGFTPDDRAQSPWVVVVSEGMAAALWPGRNPLGECIRLNADTMPCRTVVGVAEDAVQSNLLEDQHYRYYLPMDQYRSTRASWILLRVRGNPGVVGEAARGSMQRLMPGEGYVTVERFDEQVMSLQRSWSFGATLFLAFGLLALAVAAVGLYGVIAYMVTQRYHEIAVRIALGARGEDVTRLVIGQGVRVTGMGVAVGALLAYLLGPSIQPLLYEQSARDPVILGGVVATLLLVAALASAAPAVRAARADPNAVLRSE